jgi:hypothetical protein
MNLEQADEYGKSEATSKGIKQCTSFKIARPKKMRHQTYEHPSDAPDRA